MNMRTDKTELIKKQSNANKGLLKKNATVATFQFIDNRPEAANQRKFYEIANNRPFVKQLTSFQQEKVNGSVQNNTFATGNNNPFQMKRISRSQIEGMGFAGPYAGNTWQWNGPGGIHVTARREDGIVTHFHVRKDSTGGVYNRINYNENAGGDWIESDVNVPAGEELEAQMKAIAADTIRLIQALVPPAD